MSRAAKRILLFAAVPLAAAVWFLTTQTEPPPVTPPKSPLDRLMSADPAERAAAEREAVLHRARDLPLPERMPAGPHREAVRRVRDRVAALAADADLHGSLVECDPCQDGPVPLGHVIAAIFEQSGNVYSLPEEQARRPVSFARQGVRFWNAVDDLTRQAGLALPRAGATDEPIRTPAVRPQGVTFRNRTGDDDAIKIGYSGPFRIAAGPLTRRRSAAETDEFLLPLEVRSEPRLPPLVLTLSPGELHLSGFSSAPLAPGGPDESSETPFGRRNATASLALTFPAPAEGLSEPHDLRGRFRVTCVKRSAGFVFWFNDREWLQDWRRQTADGVAVELRAAEFRDDGTGEFELAVTYDAGRPFAPHSTRQFYERIALDRGDRREGPTPPSFEPSARQVSLTENGFVARCSFAGVEAAPSGLVLMCDVPTAILEVPAEFAIDGLTVRPDALSAGSDAGR